MLNVFGYGRIGEKVMDVVDIHYVSTKRKKKRKRKEIQSYIVKREDMKS